MGGARRRRPGTSSRPRPPPPRTRFRGPGNLTPLLRLIALIGLAILIVVLLVVWVEGCASDRKRDRYCELHDGDRRDRERVLEARRRISSTLLTTPGLKQEDLDAKLGGYVQRAETQMQDAEDLDPPGPMRDAERGCRRCARVSG